MAHPALAAVGRAVLIATITILFAFGLSLVVHDATQKQTLKVIQAVETVARENREVVCLVVVGFADQYPPKVDARIHALCDPVLGP